MQTNGVGSSGTSNATATSGMRDVNLDDFLKLMITELQNQDPMNPMENHQILQQMSQIREIEATDALRKTLDAVLLGQNLVSASSMIGRQIDGLSDAGVEVQGIVQRVSIEDGSPRLFVGDEAVRLSNVRAIRPIDAGESAEAEMDWLEWLASLGLQGADSTGQ